MASIKKAKLNRNELKYDGINVKSARIGNQPNLAQ